MKKRHLDGSLDWRVLDCEPPGHWLLLAVYSWSTEFCKHRPPMPGQTGWDGGSETGLCQVCWGCSTHTIHEGKTLIHYTPKIYLSRIYNILFFLHILKEKQTEWEQFLTYLIVVLNQTGEGNTKIKERYYFSEICSQDQGTLTWDTAHDTAPSTFLGWAVNMI